MLTICFVLTTLGICRSETAERYDLGLSISRFEGMARVEGTGDDLDSVRAILAEGMHSEASACSSMLTTAFSNRDFELDAAPELGAQSVAAVTTRDLVDAKLTVVIRLSVFLLNWDQIRVPT